jgi:hypothetical protein
MQNLDDRTLRFNLYSLTSEECGWSFQEVLAFKLLNSRAAFAQRCFNKKKNIIYIFSNYLNQRNKKNTENSSAFNDNACIYCFFELKFYFFVLWLLLKCCKYRNGYNNTLVFHDCKYLIFRSKKNVKKKKSFRHQTECLLQMNKDDDDDDDDR